MHHDSEEQRAFWRNDSKSAFTGVSGRTRLGDNKDKARGGRTRQNESWKIWLPPWKSLAKTLQIVRKPTDGMKHSFWVLRCLFFFHSLPLSPPLPFFLSLSLSLSLCISLSHSLPFSLPYSYLCLSFTPPPLLELSHVIYLYVGLSLFSKPFQTKKKFRSYDERRLKYHQGGSALTRPLCLVFFDNPFECAEEEEEDSEDDVFSWFEDGGKCQE